MSEAILALPDEAFLKHAKIHRRKMLLWANMIEKAMSKNRYMQTLIYLRLLQKDVNRYLIETTATQGEATKNDVTHLIEILAAEIKIISTHEDRPKDIKDRFDRWKTK